MKATAAIRPQPQRASGSTPDIATGTHAPFATRHWADIHPGSAGRERLRGWMPLIVLALCAALAFLPQVSWLAKGFSTPEYRRHALLLGLFSVYLIMVNCRKLPTRHPACRFSALPAMLLVIALCLFAANLLSIRSNIAACALMGTMLYAMAGFFMPAGHWRQAASLVLLFSLCLPLSYHVDTFIGFPLRLVCADAARLFFSICGTPMESAQTVLVIENSYAHVDLPCSGVSSLFSIAILSLVLGIMERYRIGLRWLVGMIAACALAAGANVVRVMLLVSLYHSTLPPLAKSTLHLPVGMATFIGACLAAAKVWKLLNPPKLETTSIQGGSHSRGALLFLGCALALIILTNWCAVRHQPEDRANTILAEPGSIALTRQERSLFSGYGVSRYAKAPFSLPAGNGTAFLVLASSWRGHHHPEQCIQAQGYAIEASKTLLLEGTHPARLVTLKGSNTAVLYWFQSTQRVTDDYASRVWSGFVSPGEGYVMNSIYINDGDKLGNGALADIASHFSHQSQRMLGGQQ